MHTVDVVYRENKTIQKITLLIVCVPKVDDKWRMSFTWKLDSSRIYRGSLLGTVKVGKWIIKQKTWKRKNEAKQRRATCKHVARAAPRLDGKRERKDCEDWKGIRSELTYKINGDTVVESWRYLIKTCWHTLSLHSSIFEWFVIDFIKLTF